MIVSTVFGSDYKATDPTNPFWANGDSVIFRTHNDTVSSQGPPTENFEMNKRP